MHYVKRGGKSRQPRQGASHSGNFKGLQAAKTGGDGRRRARPWRRPSAPDDIQAPELASPIGRVAAAAPVAGAPSCGRCERGRGVLSGHLCGSLLGMEWETLCPRRAP